MTFTIQNMKTKIVFEKNKKKFSYNGYAFLDEFEYTIIIVYGENKRDLMKKHLNGF